MLFGDHARCSRLRHRHYCKDLSTVHNHIPIALWAWTGQSLSQLDNEVLNMMNRRPVPRNFSTIAHAPQLPDKFTELKPEPTPSGAHMGQVLILFAMFLVGLMGMLGLATDVGYAVAARRSSQGAADAGAMAGAREIARSSTTSPTSAFGPTKAVILKNTFNSAARQ